MMVMKPILEVIVEPQVSTIRTATVDVGTWNDKSAKFGAGLAVIAPKYIGTDYHVQVLGDIPDRSRLQESGRILDIIDAG